MRLRAMRYKTGALTYRAACPVVSVGNISWGGTGKTPVVDYILDMTAKAGLRTVVLTRGYKATPPELPFPVSREDDPQSAGDEPLFLARRHPEALVLVDPKRIRAAAWAEKNAPPQMFLLDDGMQHLAMERDIDIVLLRPDDLLDGWNRVIPSGTWREPHKALERAHVFCIKADPAAFDALRGAAAQRLSSLNRPLFCFDLQPVSLTRLAPFGRSLPQTVSSLAGEAYTLVCGTGNPVQVKQTAENFLGRAPETEMFFPDHHMYCKEDAKKARAHGRPVVCTAKDAVKLVRLLPAFGDIPVWILDVRAVFGPALFTEQSFDTWWDKTWRVLTTQHSRP